MLLNSTVLHWTKSQTVLKKPFSIEVNPNILPKVPSSAVLKMPSPLPQPDPPALSSQPQAFPFSPFLAHLSSIMFKEHSVVFLKQRRLCDSNVANIAGLAQSFIFRKIVGLDIYSNVKKNTPVTCMNS